MKTIYVSGGRQDYAVITLTDSLGHDLSAATIRMGVSTDLAVEPTDWYAPDLSAYPTRGTAVVSLLIDAARAPVGVYHVWADVVDSPTTQPVAARYDRLETL